MGVALFMGAKHEEAEAALVTAQRHTDELTRQGLVNDAYTDVGGVLCDRAANLIQSGEKEQVADAVSMLKRAKFMAERAYRPNHLLLDSLNSNLAMALLPLDPEHAYSLATSCVRTGDAMEALTTGVRGEGSRLTRSAQERCAHAKSLAVLALALVKMDRAQEGLHTVQRVQTMLTASGPADAQPPPMESARIRMCLASSYWLAAETLPAQDAAEALLTALSELEQALSLLKAAAARKTHPDHVVCSINHMLLRRCLFYLTPSSPSKPLPAAKASSASQSASSRIPARVSGYQIGTPRTEAAEQEEQKRFASDKGACQRGLRALKKRLGADKQVSVCVCVCVCVCSSSRSLSRHTMA